jgi:hypothetical protein
LFDSPPNFRDFSIEREKSAVEIRFFGAFEEHHHPLVTLPPFAKYLYRLVGTVSFVSPWQLINNRV